MYDNMLRGAPLPSPSSETNYDQRISPRPLPFVSVTLGSTPFLVRFCYECAVVVVGAGTHAIVNEGYIRHGR